MPRTRALNPSPESKIDLLVHKNTAYNMCNSNVICLCIKCCGNMKGQVQCGKVKFSVERSSSLYRGHYVQSTNTSLSSCMCATYSCMCHMLNMSTRMYKLCNEVTLHCQPVLQTHNSCVRKFNYLNYVCYNVRAYKQILIGCLIKHTVKLVVSFYFMVAVILLLLLLLCFILTHAINFMRNFPGH